MDYQVITDVSVEPLTEDDVRVQLNRTADEWTGDDTALATANITAARRVAEHYTWLALGRRTLEGVLDGFPCDGEAIRLPMPPVESVTSIKYLDGKGSLQTLSTAAYTLSPYDKRTVFLNFGYSWPVTQAQREAVQVHFACGFDNVESPPVGFVLPKEVRSALLLMVAWLHEHRGDEMDPDDIQPPAAKALLNTVKQWGF